MNASVFLIVLFLIAGVYTGILQPLSAVMAGALIVYSGYLFTQAPTLPRDRGTATGCLATVIAVAGLMFIFWR